MLYHLLTPYADQFQLFNVFRYLTFRTGGAVMTALILSFLLGPSLIRWMRRKQGRGQPIRTDGPQSHIIEKAGTPTMGGVLILLSLTVATFLWARLDNPYVWIVMGVTLSFGGLGFLDDYLKVTKQQADGVVGSLKLIVQFAVALLAGYVCMQTLAAAPDAPAGIATSVGVPFFPVRLFEEWFNAPGLPLGLLIVPFCCVCHCWRVEHCEFDRWARRARDCSSDDCRRHLCAYRLPRRQLYLCELPWAFPLCRAWASSP